MGIYLKVKVIHKGLQYFAKLCSPMSIHLKFHRDPISNFSGRVEQKFADRFPGEERRTVGETNLTNIDTLWCKLCHEGANWHKNQICLIWRSSPELTFELSWASIHWAVIEIDPLKLCPKSTSIFFAIEEKEHCPFCYNCYLFVLFSCRWRIMGLFDFILGPM